jgi:hypothetical protein
MLMWTEVNDPERSCFMQAETGNGIRYEMIYAQQYVYQKSTGYVLCRIQKDFTQGCIGDIGGKVGIVHGISMACAAGFHPSVVKQSIEELKDLAEKDLVEVTK